MKVEYKIDHKFITQKLKIAKEKKQTHELKNPFMNIAHLLGQNIFLVKWLNLNDHISKTKNLKIDCDHKVTRLNVTAHHV